MHVFSCPQTPKHQVSGGRKIPGRISFLPSRSWVRFLSSIVLTPEAENGFVEEYVRADIHPQIQ